MDYLEFVKQSGDNETLTVRTAAFLQNYAKTPPFVLIKHARSANPFSILLRNADAFDFERWKQSLLGKTFTPLAGQIIEKGNHYYFFPEAEYEKESFCFFVFLEAPGADVQKRLLQWNHCSALLTAATQRTIEKKDAIRGSLISQILHDINTIITLQESEDNAHDMQNRIEYQKKTNEDLLFFIRSLEMMPFKVPVAQLIENSLQLAEIQNDLFLLTISPDLADITIDVELFSKAFNEIVLNAARASKRTLSKVHISAEPLPSASPFVSFDWLQITVTDKGPGISNDYLEHISEPFFTTEKADGHSGFGLANANKIMSALKGYMRVRSVKGQGTEVKLFLPIL